MSIISLTTIPSRLPHIEPCIRSLEQQGLPIWVWIPRYVERLNMSFTQIVPDFLSGCHVQIVEDLGPVTKLIPALSLDDTIITADDDVVYGSGWVQGLLGHDGATGYRGRDFFGEGYKQTWIVQNVSEPTLVDMLTGTWGACYRSAWFDDFDWTVWPRNDDIMINAHLREKGVERMVIPQKCEIAPYEAHKIDALYDSNYSSNDEGLRAVGWWR